jgi:hypothetical protein
MKDDYGFAARRVSIPKSLKDRAEMCASNLGLRLQKFLKICVEQGANIPKEELIPYHDGEKYDYVFSCCCRPETQEDLRCLRSETGLYGGQLYASVIYTFLIKTFK